VVQSLLDLFYIHGVPGFSEIMMLKSQIIFSYVFTDECAVSILP